MKISAQLLNSFFKSPLQTVTYKTKTAQHVDLNRNKLMQRTELLDHLEGKTTALELFGGMGFLSSELYQKIFNKIFFVEMNEQYIKIAKSKLDNKKYQFFNMDNMKFLEKFSNKVDFVDFDAFGSTVKIVSTFLQNYKFKNKLVIAVTDGIDSNLIRLNLDTEKQKARYIKQGYAETEHDDNPQIFFQNLVVNTIISIAQKYNYDIKAINSAVNDSWTVYAGFALQRR